MTQTQNTSKLDKQLIETKQGLQAERYVADDRTVTTVSLALSLEKPILIEGPAGVGKTELAKAISSWKDFPLIRLQCYEGLDEAKALYEWDYRKQLLSLQASNDDSQSVNKLFSEEFLLERPLLAAIRAEEQVVLLVDEIDKAEPEFESMLLELLSDFQVTIPELGTVQAVKRPIVILTSNQMRNLSEALRRRCLYLYIDYPSPEREATIIRERVPKLKMELVDEVAMALSQIRNMDLRKAPSVAEAVDWAEALLAIGIQTLDVQTVLQTLNVLIKDHTDIETAKQKLSTFVEGMEE